MPKRRVGNRWWKRVPSQRFDGWGMPYDTTWIDKSGNRHFRLRTALARSMGPALWSVAESHNAICGHHLVYLCRWCGVCTSCKWCICEGRLAA